MIFFPLLAIETCIVLGPRLCYMCAYIEQIPLSIQKEKSKPHTLTCNKDAF